MRVKDLVNAFEKQNNNYEFKCITQILSRRWPKLTPSRKVKTTEDLQMYFDKFLEM